MVSCISILFFSIKGSMSNPERFCVFNIWFAWCSGAFLADKVVFDSSALKKPVYLAIYCIIVAGFIALKLFPRPWLAALDYQFDILIWAAPMIIMINNEKWFAGSHSLILKLFSAIGLSSYSLYLFHEPLIALKNYLVHTFLPVTLQPAGILIGFLLIPLITWFSFLYIEKPFLARKRKTFVGAEPLPGISKA